MRRLQCDCRALDCQIFVSYCHGSSRQQCCVALCRPVDMCKRWNVKPDAPQSTAQDHETQPGANYQTEPRNIPCKQGSTYLNLKPRCRNEERLKRRSTPALQYLCNAQISDLLPRMGLLQCGSFNFCPRRKFRWIP